MRYNIIGTLNNSNRYLWNSNSSYNFKLDNKKRTDFDELFLQRVHTLIEQNLNNVNFGNKELAKKLQLSVSQLFRKIKAATNRSPSHYIRSVRLNSAMKLLNDTMLTISEIAFKTGFNDPSYFTRAFVKEFGVTPGTIRRRS